MQLTGTAWRSFVALTATRGSGGGAAAGYSRLMRMSAVPFNEVRQRPHLYKSLIGPCRPEPDCGKGEASPGA
jgi:hypothetical protein